MTPTQKSTFGRTRTGHSTVPGAIIIGVAGTGAFAWLAWYFNRDDGGTLFAAVIGAMTLPMFVVSAWALLVDRKTLKGATARPEESVEKSWYNKAAQGCYADMMIAIGLGAVVLNLVPAASGVPANVVINCLLALICWDFVIRYLVTKARNS